MLYKAFNLKAKPVFWAKIFKRWITYWHGFIRRSVFKLIIDCFYTIINAFTVFWEAVSLSLYFCLDFCADLVVSQVFLTSVENVPLRSSPDKVGGAAHTPSVRNSTSWCPYLDCKLPTGSGCLRVCDDQGMFAVRLFH